MFDHRPSGLVRADGAAPTPGDTELFVWPGFVNAGLGAWKGQTCQRLRSTVPGATPPRALEYADEIERVVGQDLTG